MDISFEDLVKIGQKEVRQNPDLLKVYARIFKERFGREPDCVGCSVENDWQKFVSSSPIVIKNIENMEKTFKLRDELAIYTFREVNENGVGYPVRTYGYLMTEEFAQKYLTTGTEEEIEERKKQFKVLPNFQEENQEENQEEKPKKKKEKPD